MKMKLEKKTEDGGFNFLLLQGSVKNIEMGDSAVSAQCALDVVFILIK